MSANRFIFVAAVVTVLSLFLFWFVGAPNLSTPRTAKPTSRPAPAACNEQAAQRFLEFVKMDGPVDRSELELKRREIYKAFDDTFPVGLPVSRVSEILNTVTLKRKAHPSEVTIHSADVIYEWRWNDRLDGTSFCVYVGGEPPSVVHTAKIEWDS